MKNSNDAIGLVLAGRLVERDEAWTRLLRYCGLPWGDNPAETWAYRYYDAIATDAESVTPEDVVCAGALHPGISREDLSFFWDHRDELTTWLGDFPVDLPLRDADDTTIEQLSDLPLRFPGSSLSLVTKVLHRKRPWLIPMIDREVIDLYRPVTGQRRVTDAWAPLVRCLADDLRANSGLLGEMRLALRTIHGLSISDLRTVDIIVWMGGRG